MPDGRIIYIAGEHEDHYDPDFYIYNDVVVIRPDNVIEFYAYPKEIFPPTDFHTATIIGNKILIIGCLGYQDSRVYTETPVYILDTDTFVINKVITSGQSPRWIHRHTCELSGDERTIVLKKGLLDLGAERSLIENIDDWLLDIESWTWTRLTERKWPRWEVKRLDRKSNHLWEIGMALFDFEMGWSDKYAKSIENLSEALGKTVDINHIEMAKVLYTPDIPHTKLPEVEDEYNVHRLEIDGVIVRYVEDSRHIQVTVEGSLPENIIEQLKSDMLKKLAFLENFACDIGVI
ncbi:MAG: hypothetical protein CTY16_18295 [Methylobacter sp.]|nr:MAG: hypothetical protein CTY16_18295 [Methylobacter sp.]